MLIKFSAFVLANKLKEVFQANVITLWSLIDGGVGIVGGVGKISKINSRGGWNDRGGWKKSQKLIAMTSQISLESLNLSWVHRILLCSFCLVARINKRGGWNKNVLGGKFSKN